MKKYNAPMLSDGFNGGFAVPAAAVASLLVKSFATAATKAAFAVIGVKAVTKALGDRIVTGEIPALEPCLD